MAAARQLALVVDDEPAIRKLVGAALRQQGFECDHANDGDEALQKASHVHYDAIVTDLRMPNKHGHARALEILQLENRPIIVVHTGVIEPKLANYLLMRGVDDIFFKPADFGFLAAKIKALVDRRPRRAAPFASVHATGGRGQAASSATRASDPPAGVPVTLPALSAKLAEISSVLPISPTAFDVYNMTRGYEFEMSQIAAAIQRDASLTAEVLRLANSSLYSPSGPPIIHLDEALLRIGQRRVGELALTTSALSNLTAETLPWMDLELTWKRSMAAGIALESIVELGGFQKIEEGLLLSAIMHPLGRVVLGMLFPEHYTVMIEACQAQGDTLQAQERHMFPTSHAEIMAHLLATWHIPTEAFLPLMLSLDDYSAIARLSEPTRTKSELVQAAILLGRLATGRWESWDLVQLPAPTLLTRLGVTNVRAVIEQTRNDLNKLAEFRPGSKAAFSRSLPPLATRPVPYCNLSPATDGGDLVAELLPSMGLHPVPCSAEDLQTLDEPAIVNCLGVAPTRFVACRSQNENNVVVTSREKGPIFERFALTAALPASYWQFREALMKVAEGSGGETRNRVLANAE